MENEKNICIFVNFEHFFITQMYVENVVPLIHPYIPLKTDTAQIYNSAINVFIIHIQYWS